VKVMPFPTRLLADHERLVLDIRPHWIALVLPTIAAVLIVVAVSLIGTNFPPSLPDWMLIAVLLVGLGVFLAFPVRAFLNWVTSHFVVTSDRVIHRSGWLAKQSMEIALERINDVRFHQTVLERVVGAGDLRIESGGEYGQNHFRDIRDPERIQKLIYEMAEANEARMRAPAPAESGPDDPLDQIEQLARLKEQGHISPEEYEIQKRRLLGRM
jgi:uncharacterized membrane protein YdbT with pleckstrin-like domain